MKVYSLKLAVMVLAFFLSAPAIQADSKPSFFEYMTGGLTHKKAALAAGIGVVEGLVLAPAVHGLRSPEGITAKSVSAGLIAVGVYNLPYKIDLYRDMAGEVTILDSQRFKEHGFLFDTQPYRNSRLRFESLQLIEALSAVTTLAASVAFLNSRSE